VCLTCTLISGETNWGEYATAALRPLGLRLVYINYINYINYIKLTSQQIHLLLHCISFE